MFFYFIFGLCLVLPVRFRMTCLAGIVMAASLLGAIYHPSGAILQTYTDSLVWEFIFGVLLAYLLLKGTNRLLACAVTMLLVGAVVDLLICRFITSVSLPRVLTTGLPAAGLVGGMLWLEQNDRILRSSVLLLLGNASYSLYLLHGFVLAILRREWQDHYNIRLISTHIAFLVVCVVISEGIGCMIYLFAEKPLTTILMANLKKWKG